jgi:pSer/pThr/pTyr-binding forkhead associated (FHA) protein
MPLILQAIHKEASASDPISLPEGARTFRVGRLEDNDVQINHSSISAEHALLKGSEINGVELVDCDSSNGTFVNGVRIERKELQQGDVVKFAYLAYRVVEGDALGSGEDAAVAPAEKAATPSSSTADLVAKVQALEELNRSSETQIEELRSRESQWMAEIESRKKRVEELEKENQATRLQLQKADEDANLQKDLIGKLQEESKERFELLSRAESTSGERQSEIEKLKATVESLQSQVGDLQKESGERLDRLKKTEATLAERSDELTRISAEKDRVARELNSEIEARQSVEDSLASRGRQCEDLQAQLEKSRTDLQGRGAEVLDR